MAKIRNKSKRSAKNVVASTEVQQEEALIKIRKYGHMTLRELKNVPFEGTTTTKRIRKNRSKSAKVVKVAPSARKRKSSQSTSGPKKDETPTEPSQAVAMDELVPRFQGIPLRVDERLMKQIEIMRNNLLKILQQEEEEDHN